MLKVRLESLKTIFEKVKVNILRAFGLLMLLGSLIWSIALNIIKTNIEQTHTLKNSARSFINS